MAKKFITKDSGKKAVYKSGMVRDIQDDKPRYDLIYLPMLKRLAELHNRGAKKYGENNWKKANTIEDLTRFKSSAFRHLIQALEGDETEDHLSAVIFNIEGIQLVMEKLGCDINGITHRQKENNII